uniref:IstB domain protein ATP-binding protein n=1 Tax=Shewanella putrefaciens (strain 200) TaxID=399804 RepID=E6XS73_SHEP2
MMNAKTVKLLCQQLHLPGLQSGFETQSTSASYLDMPFDDRLVALLQAQLNFQQNNRQATLKRQAKLRFPSTYLEQIEQKFYPELKMPTLRQLAKCDWIRAHQHVLLIGPTGTGKTTLACAFANEAIQQQIPVLFFRMANLLLQLVAARNENTLNKLARKIARAPLLVLDDWGNALMSSEERHLFFELIEARDQQGSLMITSQYPVTTWHETFQDATIADSVLDRIVHKSHQLTLNGESIRKQQGLSGGEHGH